MMQQKTNNMEDRIKEIVEEMNALRQETTNKIKKLIEERDKLIDEQNPPFLNPYIKYIDSDDSECIFKIKEPYHNYDTGEIFAYRGKVIVFNGTPFYHNDYFLNLSSLKEWKFISEVEFEELLTKGLDLIRKDII